jgi:alcohol dehydrogenase (cytochrome c)
MKRPPNAEAGGHLDAYDPLTGKRQWSYRSKYPLLASALATAGNLIFSGDPEGHFFALDALTGEKLWSFSTGSGNRGSQLCRERPPVHRRSHRLGLRRGWRYASNLARN